MITQKLQARIDELPNETPTNQTLATDGMLMIEAMHEIVRLNKALAGISLEFAQGASKFEKQPGQMAYSISQMLCTFAESCAMNLSPEFQPKKDGNSKKAESKG